MFEQTLIAAPRTAARSASFAFSLGTQIVLLSGAIIIPLFFIERPDVARLHAQLLAPPPPPPPPLAIKLVAVPANVIRRAFEFGKLYAPTRIPQQIANIVESELPDSGAIGSALTTGVPGGTGIANGVPYSITQWTAPPPPPPAPAKTQANEPKPTEPIRINISSGVQAAKLIHRVLPLYPPLAKQARIQGTVKLQGIISREGHIIQLALLSGHPLLAPAAIEAVKQWRYRPTLLNNEPVEVIAPIDVNFTLSQ